MSNTGHFLHIATRCALGCVAASLAAASLAQGLDPAAAYPSRPVTMVVPFAPGAAVDIDGRIFANELGHNFGQSFVMDFKPGGTMTVGMAYAARQKPDGYTLVWVTSTYPVLPLLVKDGAFDPVKDFDPVSLLNKRYVLLCVTSDFPARSIKEYVAYAKAHPGEINFGTAGAGSGQHLQGLALEAATGVKTVYVHYKSIAASYPDVISGRTQIVPLTISSGLAMLKAGKIRALAISSNQRNVAVPDVPTAAEQGANWEFSNWLGLLAPAKTPSAIIGKLQGELAKIIRIPAVQQKFSEDVTLLASTPAEFRRQLQAESEAVRKLVTENGIDLQAN